MAPYNTRKRKADEEAASNATTSRAQPTGADPLPPPGPAQATAGASDSNPLPPPEPAGSNDDGSDNDNFKLPPKRPHGNDDCSDDGNFEPLPKRPKGNDDSSGDEDSEPQPKQGKGKGKLAVRDDANQAQDDGHDSQPKRGHFRSLDDFEEIPENEPLEASSSRLHEKFRDSVSIYLQMNDVSHRNTIRWSKLLSGYALLKLTSPTPTSRLTTVAKFSTMLLFSRCQDVLSKLLR